MWPFRSRRVGRHEVGAAAPSVSAAPPVRPASYGAFAGPRSAVPMAPLVPESRQPWEPRVELGFRDGTTATLAPGSAQARALTEIATALARRD
jgi:hypothetical protein